MIGKTEESELIERLIQGDEKAYKIFFDFYKTKVFNTASGFLVNLSEAEDITQEVFIQVFRSIKQFRKESHLSTWIYRITVTKCLDHLRKTKAKKRLSFITDIFEKDDKDKKESFVNYEHPGIETDKKELSVILFKEIEKLPENQRIAFVLNKVEQLGYREVSEIMDISVPAVESLISRAKASLKKRLEKYYRN
ncbi:MAG TPA: RNA polymerase sigma factor [Ignavibacteria bacterium]|nr:RNA polymerase sigma factor [Ignavibacteria bacterium]